MKKNIWIYFIILFLSIALYAQPLDVEPSFYFDDTPGIAFPDDEDEGEDYEGLNHTQVVVPPIISATLVGLYIIENGLFADVVSGSTESLIMDGTLYAAHVPVYFVDVLRGLACTGFTIGLRLSTDFLSSQNEEFFDDFTYTGIMQTAFFSTYIAYREGRFKAESGIYSNKWREESLGMFLRKIMEEDPEVYQWRPYSFLELCVTSFEPENFTDPLVFILPIAGAIAPLIAYSHDDAIWTTGRAYIGTHEMNPALAVPLMGLFLCYRGVAF